MSENKKIILVAEDEKSIRDLLRLNLEMDGYRVIECQRGDEVNELINNHQFHLVLLDVMLPGKNGVDICREIRSHRPELPIIMLSALGMAKDKISGLKAGADDYVAKPFNYEELLLRIQKQLDKSVIRTGKNQVYKLDGISIDFTLNQISRTDQGIYKMSTKEAALLKYLLDNKNRVISRKEILANVWGYENFPNSRTVDNHIASLRKSLTHNDESPIISERGIGYRFVY